MDRRVGKGASVSNRTSLCAVSLLVTLVALSLSPFVVSPAAGSTSTSTSSSDGFLRLRGGLVFPDRDGEPGPGWLAGGALGLPLNPSVSLSVNYDHMFLDVPDSRVQTVNPLTVQLELAAPNRHGITPRAEVGVGFYDFGTRSFVGIRPLSPLESEPVRTSREAPFGMNFGGGLSVPLLGRALFDLDLRYHQTMGSSSLVMGTVAAGLTYRLGNAEDGTWANAQTNGVNRLRP